MNLRNLSNEILLQSTKELADKERELTLQVLHHLREIERRSLYAVLSYSSLFEYAVKELKFSEGTAQRRISSMRLLKDVPEIEKKIESGVLSLSALAQAQSFFRQEKSTIAEKKEILLHIENKSKREVERELVSRTTDVSKHIHEKVRAVNATHTEIKILVDDKILKDIEELRNLIAHSHPGANIKEVLGFALNKTLKTLRVKEPKAAKSLNLLPPPVKVVSALATKEQKKKEASRYIPIEIKRQVWHRDSGECSYRDPGTGRKCTCKHALELDHIIPFAVGGETTVENLRLRCRTHNQLAAVQSFGVKKIAQFVPRMR